MDKPVLIFILVLATASAQYYSTYLVYLRNNGNDWGHKGKYINNYNNGHEYEIKKNYFGPYEVVHKKKQGYEYEHRPKPGFRDHKYHDYEDAEIISSVYQPPAETSYRPPTYGWSYG